MRPIAFLLVALAAAVPARSDEVEELARRGLELLEADRVGEALAVFESALQLAPGEPGLRRGAAIALARLGRSALEASRLDEAIARFQLALGYWQDDPELNLWLGVAHYRADHFFAARNEFQHVLRHRPEDPTALAYVGYAYYREDRLRQAEEFLGRAAARSPDDAQLTRWLDRTRAERRVWETYSSLEDDHFTVRFPEADDAPRARFVLDLLADAYVRVGNDLGLYPDGTLIVFAYGGTDFRRITGTSPWIQGLYDGKVRLSIDEPVDEAELGRLLAHEYSHALLHRLAPGTPAWLEEGLAQLEEGRPADGAREFVREAFARGEGIPFEELASPFHSTGDRDRVELGYAQSFVFVNDLAGRYGKGTLVRVLARSGEGIPLSEAFGAETGNRLDELVEHWRRGFE